MHETNLPGYADKFGPRSKCGILNDANRNCFHHSIFEAAGWNDLPFRFGL